MSSSRSDERRALLALAIALYACGCSLGAVPRSPCDESSCQAAFGFGSVCGDDGFCRRAPPSPRCARTFPEDLLTRPTSYPDTIVVGSLMDRSVTSQEARENAMEVAVRSANDSGGLDGRSFGIVFCTIAEDAAFDSATRQEAAVASARYLADDLGVAAILGPSGSADTEAVFNALEGSGMLVMSPSATSAVLTEIDQPAPSDESPGLLWRTAPPDPLQTEVIASDMERRSVASVAVIHAADAYGEGIAEAFSAAFRGEVMLLPFATDSARAEQIVAAGALSVDEVLFVSSQTAQAAAFVNATVGASAYDDKGLFLTDSAANADFRTAIAGASARFSQIRGTRPTPEGGDVYNIFAQLYDTQFGEDPRMFSFTAHAHDAAYLVLMGIGWAHFNEDDGITGLGIARGLRRVSSGTALDIRSSTFQPILEAFSQGASVDVTGASGELDYDPAREEINAAIEIWTVDDL